MKSVSPRCATASAAPPAVEGTSQRQQLCLFADVAGSTQLALSLSHERYTELLIQVMTAMLSELRERGALVLPHQGDAVIGLWDESQAAQALATAQALHDHLPNLIAEQLQGLHLQLRIGVASGLVTCGVLEGCPSAYGVPLHLARRLCSAALPGETLMCERVASLLPRGVAQRLMPAALSGFALPVTLHGALPLTSRLDQAGRVMELTLLSDVELPLV